MRSHDSYIRHLLIAATAIVAVACSNPELDRQTRAALPAAVDDATEASPADVAAIVRSFYDGRDWAPAWTDDDRVEAVVTVLSRTWRHGLDPDRYGASGLAEAWHAARDLDGSTAEQAAARAAFDASATTALVSAGYDVSVGRIAPDAFDPDWSAYREVPNLAAELQTLTGEGDLAEWVDRLAPPHDGYARLQRAYEYASADPAAAGLDEAQLERMAINLDRWRWLPVDLGRTRIVVNIPEYRLRAMEGDDTTLEMRVVVGKPGRTRTPVFSDELESVVFNPYWNIPESIVMAETAPAVREADDYLARNQMEVLRVSTAGTRHIDPDDVDWDDPTALDDVIVRQRPGAGNALGQVKFLFPNPYAVYLHDTPARALFARDQRAFSHGCVRVEEPERLAAWVLGGADGWGEDRIAATLARHEETPVGVDRGVAVHLVYFTVDVDDDGTVVFFDDVYGADARQARATRER